MDPKSYLKGCPPAEMRTSTRATWEWRSKFSGYFQKKWTWRSIRVLSTFLAALGS